MRLLSVYILVLGILIIVFPAHSLHAQEGAKPDNGQKTGLSDVPDEYLKEAQAYYESCEANGNISAYYDCRCMAAQYLDKRIERGPDITPSSIVLSIGPGCMDSARIAGSNYTECLSRAPVLPTNQSVEEYCTCYANKFAKIYSRSGLDLSSESKVALQAQAGIICENPALGKQLYPQTYRLSE